MKDVWSSYYEEANREKKKDMHLFNLSFYSSLDEEEEGHLDVLLRRGVRYSCYSR